MLLVHDHSGAARTRFGRFGSTLIQALVPDTCGYDGGSADDRVDGSRRARFVISRRVISVLIGSTAFLIFVCTTLMLALKRSSLLEWMTELGNDLISSKPELDDDNLKEIFLRFQQRVVDESWHIQQSSPSLSLAARKLGVPMRHLSEAINRCYRGSYSRYLNDQRIATAQRLMREEPERLITDIMFAAGFASKSNFNKEFQRVTGLSPSIWREKSRESVSG